MLLELLRHIAGVHDEAGCEDDDIAAGTYSVDSAEHEVLVEVRRSVCGIVNVC